MDKNALDFARKLGRRVRELGERKGLTQDRAAELAGITGKYWGEVERGSVAVSAVVLDGMTSALGASVADAMDMEHCADRQELLEQLESYLKKADDRTLRLYLRLLRSLQW